METFGIVDGLDEDGDGAPCVLDVLEALAINFLRFEGLHEAFGFGVVVGIAGPAHADCDVMVGKPLPIVSRGILGGFKRSSQHSHIGGCDEYWRTEIGTVWTRAI
ncbi:hypothetical protein ABIC08_008965, partial [Bradyrhizobium sp. RT9b]